MVRRYASILALTAATLLPSFASADEPYTPPTVTPIAKGAPAPYAGVLLTPEAVAKVIADAKDCPKRTQIEVNKARDEQKAVDDKTLADVQADAKRDKAVMQAGIDQRDESIRDLASRLEKSEQARSNTTLYVGGGVLAGAAIAILSVIAVSVAK